jgi:hypothetical protein
MKNNSLTTVLLWLVAISAVASILFFWLFISNARQLRTLQAQVGAINANRPIITGLANDAVEYSKKNPAIEPLLESVGIKARNGSVTNKPAGK